MKVRVVKSFVDKGTDKAHDLNSVFDCSAERYKEIEKAGNYVEKVIEPKKEQPKQADQ